jgi:hypothetical protein
MGLQVQQLPVLLLGHLSLEDSLQVFRASTPHSAGVATLLSGGLQISRSVVPQAGTKNGAGFWIETALIMYVSRQNILLSLETVTNQQQ